MPQWVFEFGSNRLDDVRVAVDGVINCSSCSIESVDPLTEPLAKDLDSAYVQLRQGAIQSLVLRPPSSEIRYILVLPPRPSLSLWMGTIEYIGADPDWIWQRLLSIRGLFFVCLGRDEGVELQDENLSVERFPWGAWPLVLGALRKGPEQDQWVIGTGPEHAEAPSARRV
jgi:hypothetical protein